MPVSRKRRDRSGRPVQYLGDGGIRQNQERIIQLTQRAEEYLARGIKHTKQTLEKGGMDEISHFVIATLGRISQDAQEIVLLLDETYEEQDEDEEETISDELERLRSEKQGRSLDVVSGMEAVAEGQCEATAEGGA